MREYRVLLPLTVHTEDGSYTQGKTFFKDFTEEEETANVASGLLEIVEREYKVVGPKVVFGETPGNTFSMAMTMGQEATLIESGHIEWLEPKPKAKRKADRGE